MLGSCALGEGRVPTAGAYSPHPPPKATLGPRRAPQLTHIRALPTRPLGLPAGIAHYQKNTSGNPERKVKYSSTLAPDHSNIWKKLSFLTHTNTVLGN